MPQDRVNDLNLGSFEQGLPESQSPEKAAFLKVTDSTRIFYTDLKGQIMALLWPQRALIT